IDTSPPIVALVTSSNPDGTYQPGEVIDITVFLNKEVILVNANITSEELPRLALFIPYQDFHNIFAIYSSGNGTKELHFTYLIPNPPEGWHIRPLVRLDYAGTASLLENLNGWSILRKSTFPTTEANVLLPAEDVSYLGTDRDIRIDFNIATIDFIGALNPSGTYTAGDTVMIEVKFSQPVMVIFPPVLRLETGLVDRDATYAYGNTTNCLVFAYKVLAGDHNPDLDYVDTRLFPYKQSTYQLSFALDTDIVKGNTDRLRSVNSIDFTSRLNDVLFAKTRYGGVFRSSTATVLMPAYTALPLPGLPGSLSGISSININTKPNNITSVFSNVPDGCFGSGTTVVFGVSYDSAVEVRGCPVLLFYINGRDRYAEYSGGSGTRVLSFELQLSDDDVMSHVDYVDRFSLQLRPCSKQGVSLLEKPCVAQNLPDVQADQTSGRASLSSSVSISSGYPSVTGISINNGIGHIPLGSIIHVLVEFSHDVIVAGNPFVTLFSASGDAQYDAFYVNNTTLPKRFVQFNYALDRVGVVGQMRCGGRTAINLNGGNIRRYANFLPILESDLYLGNLCCSTFCDKVSISVLDTTPQVFRVYSSENGTFSSPDALHFYIEWNQPVYVVGELELELNIFPLFPSAQCVGNEVPNVLKFVYSVQEGDSCADLDYAATTSLKVVDSGVDTRAGIFLGGDSLITLPVPFSVGSLASCCRLLIDTSTPFIESIIPLKRPGIYGKNEEIIIVVRFNRPVVLSGGPPMLILQSGRDGGAGNATYVEYFEEPDVLIDIENTDVLFRYTVREDDYSPSLHHLDKDSFFLNGATFYADTTNPEGSVDTSLRSPQDFALEMGKVTRQWKYKYPKRVDVLLRDLYSSSPQQLTAKLEHLSGETALFGKCCDGTTFGKPFPLSRLGNNNTALGVDTAIGYDYLFSDTQLENLATTGSVNQSSIQSGGIPSLATDGNTDPFFDDRSVTATLDTDVNAWWQIRLAGDEPPTVRSMQIWGRKDEIWVPAIVTFVVKGYDQYPRGVYTLKIRLKSSAEAFLVTEKISMGASADDVAVAIGKLDGLQQLGVSRETLTGIIGYDKGFGWKYRVTFDAVKVPHPVIEVVDILLEGDLYNQSNTVDFHTELSYSELSRRGKAVAVSDEDTTENIWLTPFWVMLFDDSLLLPPIDLEQSKSAAIWKKQFFVIEDRVQFNLEVDMSVRYVKIQRSSAGSLSVAEVEIYAEALDTLEWYSKGSPIIPAPPMRPYQPLDSLQHQMGELRFDGRWVLQIDDLGLDPPVKRFDGSSGGLSSISDWVLIVTDLAGLVHTYYMDLRAEIITLPKYGDL
ncbi:unnamed protein product, partial [Ectocarpus fasciculatus]